MQDLPGTDKESRTSSWLVGPPPDKNSLPEVKEKFETLTRQIETDAEAHVLRTIGPASNPRLLVVEMDDATAERYQQEFEPDIRFERNLPLQPLGGLPE